MKIKKIISGIAVSTILVFLISRTKNVMDAVTASLSLCATAVVPTLFPFFVVSGLLVNLGIVSVLGKILAPVSKILFKTSGKGAVAFLIGVLCGYPTGAKVIADMCKNSTLSKEEGERLLAFCNNSGPLFVIGTIGSVMLKNHSSGVLLYIVHLLSAVITGVLLRPRTKVEPQKNCGDFFINTFGKAVALSVENAVKSILNVCGYVVFFGVLCRLVNNPYITAILEVTYGAKEIINCNFSQDALLILLSGVIGFGGICVFFQVQSVTGEAGLSTKIYIIGKIMQGAISMLIMFLYTNLTKALPVFAEISACEKRPYIVMLFVLCIIVCLTKKVWCDILIAYRILFHKILKS